MLQMKFEHENDGILNKKRKITSFLKSFGALTLDAMSSIVYFMVVLFLPPKVFLVFRYRFFKVPAIFW